MWLLYDKQKTIFMSDKRNTIIKIKKRVGAKLFEDNAICFTSANLWKPLCFCMVLLILVVFIY